MISISEKFAYARRKQNSNTKQNINRWSCLFCNLNNKFFQSVLCYLTNIHFELIFYFALFPKDIHYLALDKGELALAEVARKRASDIDAESITSGIGKN